MKRNLSDHPRRELSHFRNCNWQLAIIFFTLTILLDISGPLTAADPLPRPNIILILADDLGWADLGCYGSHYYKTPHLDRLASNGVRFTQAYAAAPVGCPTRAAIMTGKYPARLGITDDFPGTPDQPGQRWLRPALPRELPATEKALAAHLKAAGYVTAHVGKWQLGGKGAGPLERGFSLNVGGDDTGTPLSYFAPFGDKTGRVMPGLDSAPDGEYLTDRLTAVGENFMEANRDRPFFLYLSHYAVHLPLKAKAEKIAKYKEGPLGAQGNPTYAAMIESLDESVGRILQKLDDLKLTENTFVIFTSSNGGLCCQDGEGQPPTVNAPLREGKGFLYDGGLRVPLIMRRPGVTKTGRTIGAVVSAIDLFPTILEIGGIKDDDKRDGVGLTALLAGETLDRDALYWHYPHYHHGKPAGVIRSGDWKMIEYYETGRRELFNMKNDPSESRNTSASQGRLMSYLTDKLDSWRKEVGAKMMTPNPDYAPNPPGADGTILLQARGADIHGVMLRYEPLPNKNTLGFWTRADDWVSWEFTVTKPGTFTVAILQGCGTGNGGSDVELSIGEQVLKFVVEDTGGFQNFKSRDVGVMKFDKAGRYTLELKAKNKVAAAVMDVRSIRMRPGP